MQTLLHNKKASHDFEILEKFSAGIELTGAEVKTLRKGLGNISSAHISVRGGEAYLLNAHIPPYQPLNIPKNYDPYRNRKLLLHKKELAVLASLESQKGLTIVPLSVYSAEVHLKLSLAVVRHKKKHDKRETLKRRETERDIRRTLKAQ
jgi:SsrA-binding protein